MKTTYILFGEKAANQYHEGNFENLKNEIDNGDYSLFKTDKSTYPQDLLAAAEGYGGHAMITKLEYEKFLQYPAVSKVYATALSYFNNYIGMEGNLDYADKIYGNLADGLTEVEVGFFGLDDDSSYADTLREEGFTMTAEAALGLQGCIASIEEDLKEQWKFADSIGSYLSWKTPNVYGDRGGLFAAPAAAETGDPLYFETTKVETFEGITQELLIQVLGQEEAGEVVSTYNKIQIGNEVYAKPNSRTNTHATERDEAFAKYMNQEYEFITEWNDLMPIVQKCVKDLYALGEDSASILHDRLFINIFTNTEFNTLADLVYDAVKHINSKKS